MKKILFLLFLFSLSLTQDDQSQPNQVLLQDPDPSAAIKQREIKKKRQINLDKTAFEELSFLVKRQQEFIVTPEAAEEIKGTFDVFWKQKNVFLLANVQSKQEVQVQIIDGVRNIVFQDKFYTTSGFNFEGIPKHSYRIRLINRGNNEKLVIMRISEAIKTPATAAKKSQMDIALNKLQQAYFKLHTALSDTKTGYFLDQEISGYVLHQSSSYSHFQIFECFIIVLFSCLQVMFVTKMLKSDIIV